MLPAKRAIYNHRAVATGTSLGYSAVESGLAQLPLAATIAVSATPAPRLVRRVGFKPTLVAGLLLFAGGLLWLARVPPHGAFLVDLLAPSLVVGLGEGASGCRA